MPVDPRPSARLGPDPVGDALREWRPAKGHSRVVVELPAEVVDEAVRRARRRRISLAALIERALTADGVAAILAALIVGLAFAGCAAPEAEKPPCEFPITFGECTWG